MTTITIRNVPEEAHAELVRRATAKGQSLQEFAKELLTREAGRPDMRELMQRIEKRVKQSGTHLTTAEILELKDLDKR